MRRTVTTLTAALLLATLTACPEPKRICTPGTTREDLPDNPGTYYVCVDSGTGWTKVKAPKPTPTRTTWR